MDEKSPVKKWMLSLTRRVVVSMSNGVPLDYSLIDTKKVKFYSFGGHPFFLAVGLRRGARGPLNRKPSIRWAES